MGLKLIVIVILGGVLLIPLAMIDGKISERERYRNQASRSIAESWTEAQRVYTPMYIQPYVVEESVRRQQTTAQNTQLTNNFVYEKVERSHDFYGVSDLVSVETRVNIQKRKRGIYEIPVYTSKISLKGTFSPGSLANIRNQIKRKPGFLRLGEPRLAMVVSDPRGFIRVPQLKVNGETLAFSPGSTVKNLPRGLHIKLPGDLKALHFEAEISLRGMQDLSFVPVALDAHVEIHSSWPHPEFFGKFLPAKHEINNEGFIANWNTNHFSSGVIQNIKSCANDRCGDLKASSFGVKFIEGVDVYLQAERAIKYGILFIGLSFVTFFIFETMKKLRIHPIQYTLVGLAIAVFYLLLVSLGEHLAFALSYLIAALACISLLGYYIRFVLGSWCNAGLFALLFSILYGLLFVIIQSEDAAMLMGAVLIFTVLAAIMVITRNLDWYELSLLRDVKVMRKQKQREREDAHL